jgi:hypothetical protein
VRIGEPLVHPFRRVDFRDGNLRMVPGKLREHGLQPLTVAAPGRIKVEYHQFVGGVFEEGADGRGVDVVHFRGRCDDEGGGEERPHRQ